MQRVGRILILSTWVVAAHATEIRVVGSDLLGGEFARVTAEFSRQDGAPVKLDLRGTRPGAEDLLAGRADVGLFLLPATEPAPGGMVVSRIIGYQVMVMAVPTSSPLKQVTLPQLCGWFGVTPGERPTQLFALAPRAGLAWPLFRQVVLAGAGPSAVVEWVADEVALAEKLRASDKGLGVAGAGILGRAGLRALAIAADATDPAQAPTPENIHRGHYPLRLVLHVTFRRTEAPQLQRFLKFLLSDEAATALAPAGFVPLPIGARTQLVFELEEMR